MMIDLKKRKMVSPILKFPTIEISKTAFINEWFKNQLALVSSKLTRLKKTNPRINKVDDEYRKVADLQPPWIVHGIGNEYLTYILRKGHIHDSIL
jgi:hypothetical protein